MPKRFRSFFQAAAKTAAEVSSSSLSVCDAAGKRVVVEGDGSTDLARV